MRIALAAFLTNLAWILLYHSPACRYSAATAHLALARWNLMYKKCDRVYSMKDEQEGTVEYGPESVLGINWYWVELDDGTLSLVSDDDIERVDDATDRVSVRTREHQA